LDSGFFLELHFLKHGVEQQLRVAYRKNGVAHERKLFYNHTPLQSLSELLGVIPGVLLSPEDSDLVKGTPAVRRDFLDLQIAQTDPLYLHHLTRYNRAMRQRNHLLRGQQTATIEAWEAEMAQSASYIIPMRKRLVGDIERRATAVQQNLSNSEDLVTVVYKESYDSSASALSLAAAYQEQFARLRQREMLMGHSLYGPHKDDLLIAVNSRQARQYASEGQQRTLSTALRLAQWQRLQEESGTTPIMLVDDLGMGLDAFRRERFLRVLEGLGQIFVSLPEAAPFGIGCAHFHLLQGHVQPR
jgi:DNA replication and repair protein RecF